MTTKPSIERAAAPTGPWAVLAVTSLAVFAVSLDTTILYVAFPDIRATFASTSNADLSWVLNAYTIVFGALLVTAGRLADRAGRKRVFMWGAIVFTASSLLCALAQFPVMLIASRVLQGVGAAMLLPASLALVLAAFPRDKRPIAVSIWGAVGALAAAIGPALGSWIVATLGWRWAFYLNLPIGAFAVVRSHRRLIESREATPSPRPDALGVVLAIGAPSLLALAMVQAGVWGLTNLKTVAAVAGSAVMLVALVAESARSRAPVIDLALFRDLNYRIATWGTLVFSTAFAAMFFGAIFFLTQVWHYSIQTAGLAMTPGPLLVIPFAIISGRIASRRGHRLLLAVGGLAYAIGALRLYVGATATPEYLTLFLPNFLLTAVGVGFVLPSLTGVAVHSLHADRFALGVAVNSAVRQVGSVLGVAFVFAALTVARSDELAPFHAIWLLIVAAGAFVALISLRARTSPGDRLTRSPELAAPPAVVSASSR